jgi:hypothetical protein
LPTILWRTSLPIYQEYAAPESLLAGLRLCEVLRSRPGFEATVLKLLLAPFLQFNEFVHSALQGGGRVLVHSNAGISRSAALTIGYIMEYCNVCAVCCCPCYGAVFVLHLFDSSTGIQLLLALTQILSQVDFEQAYHLVQARRFCICPNEGFTAQLMVCILALTVGIERS